MKHFDENWDNINYIISKTKEEKSMKTFDETWKDLEKRDQIAKKKGVLLDRYIAHPFADGQAIYIIVKVNKRTVNIQVKLGLGDDWILPAWGEATKISLEEAKEFIRQRDAMSSLFGKKT